LNPETPFLSSQEDVLIGVLSVRESIQYGARVRLPRGMARASKAALVAEVIAAMGLSDCADTPIGNWHMRGVSIAMELITRPSLLLLARELSNSISFLFLEWAYKWSTRTPISDAGERAWAGFCRTHRLTPSIQAADDDMGRRRLTGGCGSLFPFVSSLFLCRAYFCFLFLFLSNTPFQ
jgi:hypothetical protein